MDPVRSVRLAYGREFLDDDSISGVTRLFENGTCSRATNGTYVTHETYVLAPGRS